MTRSRPLPVLTPADYSLGIGVENDGESRASLEKKAPEEQDAQDDEDGDDDDLY